MALRLGSAIPDSARDIPTTRRPTRITPPAPSLSQTGGSGGSLAGIPTSASYAAHFLSLNLHLATSHRTLSKVFSFIADTIGYTNTSIPISSCGDLVSTTGTIPGLSTRHYAIPALYVAFMQNTPAIGTGGGPVRRVRPEHFVCSNRTDSGPGPR